MDPLFFYVKQKYFLKMVEELDESDKQTNKS